ncbi:hypothetical protein EW146_g9108 [Bondarzewia mesenterica]|uniref:Glycosyl transferase 64 domain-containing protein n=1 Tax=Bondarzewia mesenterica TaxID=1095465 RepID=A0A4S4L953_9AGAM|nr:hypothetical protein EW146_g9108 [Bondarzewia mesenterica]
MSYSSSRKAEKQHASHAPALTRYTRLLLVKFVFVPCLCAFYLLALLGRHLANVHNVEPSSVTPLLRDVPDCQDVPHSVALDPLPPLSTRPAFRQTHDGHELPLYAQEWQTSRPILDHSLTVVLTVTAGRLPSLETSLVALHEDPTPPAEIIVLCSETILSVARHILRSIVIKYSSKLQVEMTLRTWHFGAAPQVEALIQAALQSTTEWVLILNHDLDWIKKTALRKLLKPQNVSFPLGPRGFGPSSSDCLVPSQSLQPASFLEPPFALPSYLLPHDSDMSAPEIDSWRAFGQRIARGRPDLVGGVVLPSTDTTWCQGSQSIRDRFTPVPMKHVGALAAVDPAHQRIHNHLRPSLAPTKSHGTFGLFFPSWDDLQAFSSAACRLTAEGRRLRILLYGEHESQLNFDRDHGLEMSIIWDDVTLETDDCALHYQIPLPRNAPASLVFSSWLDSFHDLPDVLIGLAEISDSSQTFVRALSRLDAAGSTLIQIPRADLPYCDWIGTLTVQEWKNWNVPQIDISIITNNRPGSLSRLLSSLKDARYFGDRLTLRVNVDQSADKETLQLIDGLRWDHGSVFLHHRVVHGGLLPAVVESWYPSSNDTYGLLLEDDVEVSPLFYAWLKMSVLRYRYGQDANRSHSLFGISLYQQKNIELRPEGRRPFNPRHLFANSSIPHPITPYLSQIPCSWGALYFPEHWREFHAYLSARLSQPPPIPLSLKDSVVPNVRSNKWTRSWKKYFIELVYLRGYVMLYPNYADFFSLSTNHLEIGSHVKRMPRAVYDKKRSLFELPLMLLPDSNSSVSLQTGLLDLPNGRLPAWSTLPVLDLHGLLVSVKDMRRRGAEQRSILFNCSSAATEYDVQALLCIQPRSEEAQPVKAI